MGKNNDIFGLDKNGKELPIEVNLSPYSVGNETYVIAVIRDVSDRYWKHARLIDREERLRVLLESTGAIPWAADPITWCFTYVGPQATDILGYPVEHWYKKDFWINKIHPDDRESVVQTCLDKSNVYSHYELEYRMIKSDGGFIWVHDIVNVEFEKGKPIILRGFLIDITERIKTSDELFTLQQELTHVARVSAAGELTASVAHELNQPLAAIMSNAQAAQHFLQREIPDLDEVKAALADIVNDDRRAGEVINRLRKMLLKGEPTKEPLLIVDLIVEVIKFVKNDAVNKGVRIVFEKSKSILPPIEGDRIQLQQVVLNIMLNAFDAMLENNNEERRLVIRAIQSSTDNLTVEFSDNGKGFEKQDINRLFDAFYTTKKNGMGMGLAICRSIIESHGGRLWATQNENGEGATFHFSLPLQLENIK
jgi:PAS domain S-box-containing protein